jgi:hypothetical protein
MNQKPVLTLALGVLLGLIGTSLTAWLVSRVLNESMSQAFKTVEKLTARVYLPPEDLPTAPDVPVARTAGISIMESLTEDAVPLWAEEMDEEEGWLVDPATGRLMA